MNWATVRYRHGDLRFDGFALPPLVRCSALVSSVLSMQHVRLHHHSATQTFAAGRSNY
jgi:hypothetical protein